MREWGEALHMTCRVGFFNMTWHIYMGRGVWTACVQRATDVDKTSV